MNSNRKNHPLTPFYKLILSGLLSSSSSLPLQAERALLDFGRTSETTPSPDLFGQYWNNVAGSAAQGPTALIQDSAQSTSWTLQVTNDFDSVSTNSLGGEPIYVPTATGDFAFVSKSGDDQAAVQLAGLDLTRVYDLKIFVSSNRASTQSFLTDYLISGATTETVSLEAITNADNVASINGMVPNASGVIDITITPALTSNTFGGIGILEIVERAPSDPVTPDPEPLRWTNLGTTPNPPAFPNSENPDGLTAYVIETADPFTGYAGAGESLRRAGFHVLPLPIDTPPFDNAANASTDVDLILFGSFASEDSRYQVFMANYAHLLDDYISRGGYLVHLAQADQTEIVPPFLPTAQSASRNDTDFTEAYRLSPLHPLIQGFPLDSTTGRVTYTMPHLIPNDADNVVWESFDSFSGFEVILSGDPVARNPALMEGSYGQGQLLLAAMTPDKIINASTGSEQPDGTYAQLNQNFFENLYTQTRLVRDQASTPITITPQPGEADVVGGAWTIALLPDTQVYSQNRPGVFAAQTSWLRQNARRYNIRQVLHLGDIVNINSESEWQAARSAMGLLDGHLPYALVPGNHDYGPNGNASTRDTLLNNHFLFDDYSNRTGFGGAMDTGKLDNTYHFFQAGGYDWIVMCLEWGPRDNTIAWADSVLTQFPNHKAILVTHAYLNNNDLRYDITDTVNPQNFNPHTYNTSGGVNDGEELWQDLVRKHNFALTLNGHALGDGTGFRTDANDAGQNVHQMLANYQFLTPLGGNGFLRLLTVQPDGSVQVRSYSPVFNEFLDEAYQEFTFNFEWYSPADLNSNNIPDYYDSALDSDGDGIDNEREFTELGTNPFALDSDGDSIADDLEELIGTNPAVSDRATAQAILQNNTQFNLFQSSELIDVQLGELLISPTANSFQLDLQLQVTDQPGTLPFTDFGSTLQWTVPNNGDKAFLRVRAREVAP